MTLTIPIPSPTIRRDELFTPIAELLPLPQETYPRTFDKRKPDKGYYIALCLILSLWVITPLSCAYLLWFALFGPGISGRAGLTSTIFAAYALTEVVFAIYHYHLIHFVQAPAPPSELPLDIRNALFQKVLHAGLSHPQVPSRLLDPSYRNDSYFAHAENMYEAGLMSAKDLHHARDHEYEDSMGIGRPRRRVGRITQEDKNVIDSFVEEHEGDRGRRLRQQIEADAMGIKDEEEEERALEDAYGNPIMLHAHDRRAVEFRERLRTWFNHAPWESLRRQNVLIWLSFASFGIPLEDAKKNKQFMTHLEKTMKTLEARTGMTVPEGHNPEISILRLTLDPVNAKGRPLLLYALSNGINAFLRSVVYPHRGMSLYREGELEYLIRIPPGWTPERNDSRSNSVPVVYLHGLGFGLLQNHLLIKHLIKSLPTHPLLIPLSPHTSQSVFHPRHLRPYGRPEMVNAIKRICTKWGFWEEGDEDTPVKGGVSMLSHSNGSVAHGWVLKDCPSLVKRSTFVDPVVFCLWEGDVCHSFCYRQPATALELLLYYFIASEVGIANYIQRHFDWADNTLFFEEIPNGLDPRKTAFFLGGKDIIIDAARTRKYLEGHGVTARGLHWDAKAGHGDGLSGDSRNRVVMFAGTGSTRGWRGWIKHGRHRHSLGMKDWQERQAASGWGMGVELGVPMTGDKSPISRSSRSSFSLPSQIDSSEPVSPSLSDE